MRELLGARAFGESGVLADGGGDSVVCGFWAIFFSWLVFGP